MAESTDGPHSTHPQIEIEIADAWLRVNAEKYPQIVAAAERLGKPLNILRHDELLNMVQQIEKELLSE